MTALPSRFEIVGGHRPPLQSLFPTRLPLRAESRAIEFLPPYIDPGNLPAVGNVIERIRVEDREVGVLAGSDEAGVHVRGFGGIACCRDDGLHRSQAHPDPAFGFQLAHPTDGETRL